MLGLDAPVKTRSEKLVMLVKSPCAGVQVAEAPCMNFVNDRFPAAGSASVPSLRCYYCPCQLANSFMIRR